MADVDLEFVEQLIALVGRSTISELELTRDGWHVRIAKAAPGGGGGGPQTQGAMSAPVDPGPASPSEPTHLVSAGLVGTFYRAPAPGQPAFVSPGDVVEEGQTLGILEAMKTMIAVQADRAGRIVAIHGENGVPVQAGDPLFTIALAE